MKRQILIAGLLAAIACAAEPPPWKNDLSPAAPGSFPPMPPGVLELQVSWKGLINAGTLRVEFAPHDAKKTGTYVVRSSAASTGAAALLFPYQSHFWSELDPSSLKPRLFHAIETDRKETTTSITRHWPDRVAYQESNQSLKTGAITRNERAFSFSPVFDIFSAMLHVRSQKLADNDLISLDGVPGLDVNRFRNLLHILHDIMEFLFCCSQKARL